MNNLDDMSNVQKLIDELVHLYDNAINPLCPSLEETVHPVETVRDAKYYMDGYLDGYHKAAYHTLRALIVHGFYDPDKKKE